MAKGPRVVGAKPELTAEEIEAARNDLINQARAAGTLGLEGQDVGPQDGPPIEMPSESIKEDLREISVEGVTPQVISPITPEVTSEVTPEVTQEPESILSKANQEKLALTPEQQRERENIRVPSVMEAAGVSRNRLNLREAVGNDNADRFLEMEQKLEYTHPITMSVKDAIQIDPILEVSDSGFQESLAILDRDAFNVEDKSQRPMRVNIQGEPLRLNRGNILLSNKVLGIGIKNPKFDPLDIKLNEKGSQINYDSANQQPFIVDKNYVPTIAAIVEDMLVKKFEREGRYKAQNELDQPPVDIEMDAVNPTASEVYSEGINKASFGRSAFQAIRRDKAYFSGEPTDSYVDDYKNTTQETFEAIHDILVDLYATIAPNMVTITKGIKDPTTGEYLARDISLTPEAYITLQESRIKVPDFKAKFLKIKPFDGTIPYEGQLLKTETGFQPRPDSANLEEALVNTSNVKSVIDTRRGDLALMLGVHALATVVSDQKGNVEPANFTLNAMDMGSQRMNKIRSIYTSQKVKRDVAQAKLDDLLNSPNPQLVEKQIAELREQVKEYEYLMAKFKPDQPLKNDTNELQSLYYQHVNKNLETLSFIARNGSDPFYHTYVVQKGSTRFTTSQYLSFQNSHLKRNVIGSGAKVEIKPLAKSPEQDMFLWSVGTIFFKGGGKTQETVVKNTLFNIKERTPTYVNVVSLGNKLKQYLSSFDKSFAVENLVQVKSTPKGITGLEKLQGTLPQAMLEDKELMTFLEALSEGKDSHKHFIQTLDYMMALADYDQALQSGKSVHVSVNTVEMDGLSNGISNVFMGLGMYEKLPRIGVTRAEESESVLGFWKDLPGALTIEEAYEGDIRDTLRKTLELNMSNEVSSLAMFNKQTMNQFGYSETDIPKLRKILQSALKPENKTTFLKSPIITFPYGQETRNLIGSIYETIVSDPELERQIKDFFGESGIRQGALFLDTIRLQALRATLGDRVMAFSKLAKDSVDLSSIYNRYMSVQNPTGGQSMFVGKQTKRVGPTFDLKRTARRDKETGREKPLIEAMKRQQARAEAKGDLKEAERYKTLIKETESPRPLVVAKKKSFISPLAPRRGISGGVAHGSVLPNIAQGLDGATIIKIFSGPAWRAITQASGGEAFVLPVYDALITDLRSATKTLELVNKQWYNMTSNATFVDDMVEGLDRNLNVGRKQFAKLAAKGGRIDELEHGDLVDHVINTLRYGKFDSGDESIKNRAKGLIATLTSSFDKNGIQTNDSRNYQNLYQAQLFIEENLYKNTLNDFKQLAKEAEEGRAEIRRLVKNDEAAYGHRVLQYTMDDIGIPTEAMRLLES